MERVDGENRHAEPFRPADVLRRSLRVSAHDAADPRARAVAIAHTYAQGDIAGLDDATTRRLVASVVLSVNRQGDDAREGRWGHLGRYQVGAAWLADAGLVQRERLDDTLARSESRNASAWARSGGMQAFLRDQTNWTAGASMSQYLGDHALQDRAFRTVCDRVVGRARDEGLFADDEPGRRVAGFLKVQHIAGYSAAVAALTGGRVQRDAAGISNYDLMHDITRDRDGLNAHLAVPPRAQTALPPGDAAHPAHALYGQALAQLPREGAYAPPDARERAAAALAAHAQAAGLQRIDTLVRSVAPDGRAFLVAVQGDPANPASRSAHLPETQALAAVAEPAHARMASPSAAATTTQTPLAPPERDPPERGPPGRR